MKVTLLAMAMLFAVASGSQAQGVFDLMTRVEDLEKRLIEVDATYRADIAGLNDKMAKSTTPDISSWEESIAVLLTRISLLEIEVGELKTDLASAKETEETLYADLNTRLQPPSEHHSPVLDETTTEMPDLQISGYVDASYFYDGPTRGSTFGFDQTEVNVEKTYDKYGAVRADVEWVSDGAGGFDLNAEQGYVVFSPTFLQSVSLTFGKFNAPIGFELLDAPDMYQYSHALVFNYGLPTNLTGAMFSTQFGAGVDLSLYLCNGWDQNVDVNTGKTFGGRVGFAPVDWGASGFSLIRGALESAEGDFTTIFDWDITATPLPAWTIGAELNIGNQDVSGTSYKWFGLLLMNHWDFNDWSGLTFRYDLFDDGDGVRLGSGIGETRQALTFAPTFALYDGMGALMEFRADFSNQEVFESSNGTPEKSAIGLAYEMTYSF